MTLVGVVVIFLGALPESACCAKLAFTPCKEFVPAPVSLGTVVRWSLLPTVPPELATTVPPELASTVLLLILSGSSM